MYNFKIFFISLFTLGSLSNLLQIAAGHNVFIVEMCPTVGLYVNSNNNIAVFRLKLLTSGSVASMGPCSGFGLDLIYIFHKTFNQSYTAEKRPGPMEIRTVKGRTGGCTRRI